MIRDELQETTLALQHFYEVGAVTRRTPLGVIYEAVELPFERPVAIHSFEALSEAEGREPIFDRIEDAAGISTAITAQAALRTADVGRLGDGSPFVVTEPLQGRTLREHLESSGPLEIWQALRLVEQVGEVVAQAHELGLRALGLDAGRVLIEDYATMRVRVFGLGLVPTRQEILTIPDAVVGVDLVRHVPPAEFLQVAEDLDAVTQPDVPLAGIHDERAGEISADIYGLAALAFEALFGAHPYFRDGRDVGDGVLAMLQESPLGLDEAADIPRALSRVIHEVLRPRGREYANAASWVSTFRAAMPEQDRLEADERSRPVWLPQLEAAPIRSDEVDDDEALVPLSWLRWSAAAIAALILLNGLVYWLASGTSVTTSADVPEMLTAEAGEGVDVVVRAEAPVSVAEPGGPRSEVKAEAFLISTRGDLIPVGETPLVLRDQVRGSRVELMLRAEGARAEQATVLIPEEGAATLFVNQLIARGEAAAPITAMAQ